MQVDVLTDELPVYARRNPSGLYTWNGVDLPSVTTVIGLLGHEHLRVWYGKMAAAECAELIEKCEEGVLSVREAHEAIKNVPARQNAAIRYRDYRGHIGTLVHHSLYTRVTGENAGSYDWPRWLEGEALRMGIATADENANDYPFVRTLVQAAMPYISNAFDWLELVKPEFESIGQEAVVVSETHDYAGTMDAIAKIKGLLYALDFKTSKSISEFEFRMQVEAYRRADFIGVVPTGEKFDMPKTDRVAILHIRPLDPCILKIFEPSDELFEAFLCLRYIWGILEGNRKKRKPKVLTEQSKGKKCPFEQELD